MTHVTFDGDITALSVDDSSLILSGQELQAVLGAASGVCTCLRASMHAHAAAVHPINIIVGTSVTFTLTGKIASFMFTNLSGILEDK